MTGKSDLRSSLFRKLKKVSLGDRRRAARKICSTLACLPDIKASRIIASYVPMKSEPDLSLLLREPPHSGAQIAASRIDENGEIAFHLLQSTGQLIESDLGFREPDPERCPLVDPADIDLVLTPGVAFDPSNFTRLGRGKGHYDRFLEKYRASRSKPGCVLGIAYQLQLVDVPREAHDQPMDGLITEAGYLQTPLTAES